MLPEELGLVAELDDFSGTNKCEVERVEEKQDVLALKIGQLDWLDGTLGMIPR